jgi:hypothetical protein
MNHYVDRVQRFWENVPDAETNRKIGRTHKELGLKCHLYACQFASVAELDLPLFPNQKDLLSDIGLNFFNNAKDQLIQIPPKYS